MVMLTLIISACSSNPADDMETGIQYTYIFNKMHVY